MQAHAIRNQLRAWVAVMLVLTFSCGVHADPPSRVGRLGYTIGSVSFSATGDNHWVQAPVNRPLSNGDRLWTDPGALAEIQIGTAMVHLNGGTSVSVLNLDDRIAQLQLAQGTLHVNVRRLDANQVFEIDTPNLAFTLRHPGDFRIEVDPDGGATTIIVRRGQGDAYAGDTAYVIDVRQAYRFTGTGLRDYQLVFTPRLDDFDRWSNERDRAFDNSGSARYVSQDVIGYQDLDASGTWRQDNAYGYVWIPNHVAADWAPYRDGHWVWLAPWGWTWIDDAPWGFAVSHYGRWTNMRGIWGWVPGPVRSRAYYAPALVVFVGNDNFQLALTSGMVSGVAWFPLAPREVYRPSYPASRSYVENINRSNTVINNTAIRHLHNTTNVNHVVYANRQVPGAVIAVPRTTFEQSHPASGTAVRASREALLNTPVTGRAPVAPTERGVRGAVDQGDPAPARVLERPVITRTVPAPVHRGVVAQQPPLTVNPAPVHLPPPAPPAPVVQQAVKHESAPAIQQTEPRPPLAGPQPAATHPQQAPHLPPRAQDSKPDANPPVHLRKDRDEPTHEEGKHKRRD